MRWILFIGWIFISCGLSAQGIRDSIFRIHPLEVTAQQDFDKEQAGMKETRIDTFIMRYQLAADLASLLQENTNIHIKDYGRGALSTASFRGTAPSHTQVTWNGININSPMLGMVDFTLVPVFLADELNILHGAASIAAQSGGLGGLIEIQNKPDWNNTFSGNAYAGIGSFRTSQAYTRINTGNQRVQASTRVYSSYSLNNYPFVNKNIIEKDTVTGELYHPVQENRDAAFRKTGLSQEFYFRLNNQSALSSRTWIQDASRSVPTVLSNEYDEKGLQRDNLQRDRTLKHVLEYDLWQESTRLKMRSGIDLQVLDYTLQSEISGLDPVKSVNSLSRMLSWYNHAELRQDLTDQLSLKTSASLNRYGINTMDSATMNGYDTTRLEGSLLTGIYYSPAEPVQLSAQLRKDLVTGFETPLIYTFGISVRPLVQQDLFLKASLARNYHLPALNDLFWQPGGNPDLLPEEGHTAELSALWKRSRDLFSLQTSLTGYYSRINNWILWLPGFKGYWEPVNLSEVRSYGLEYHLSATAMFGETMVRVHGNLALAHTRNEDEMVFGEDQLGMQLPFIPKVNGNVNVALMRNGWFIIWQNSSTGMRYLLNSNELKTGTGDAGPSRIYSLYPHYLNNMSLGKQVKQPNGTFTLELKIDNLFNETYRNVLMRFMPGRSFLLQLKYDF